MTIRQSGNRVNARQHQAGDEHDVRAVPDGDGLDAPVRGPIDPRETVADWVAII